MEWTSKKCLIVIAITVIIIIIIIVLLICFVICLSFCRVISFLFTLKQVLIKSIAEPKIVIFLGNFLAGKNFRFGTKICALI